MLIEHLLIGEEKGKGGKGRRGAWTEHFPLTKVHEGEKRKGGPYARPTDAGGRKTLPECWGKKKKKEESCWSNHFFPFPADGRG